jgi:hypothetical protein
MMLSDPSKPDIGIPAEKGKADDEIDAAIARKPKEAKPEKCYVHDVEAIDNAI